MRIAQVAPLIESVPPRLYGGSERVVSFLTEELVAQGHDVTLFASGDSITAAELVPCSPQAIRLDPAVHDYIPYYMLMLDKVRERAADFDIIHFHIDHFHFPLFRPMRERAVTTLHGRQDRVEALAFYSHFNDMPLISISMAQRKPLLNTARFIATVHHGLPVDLLKPNFNPRGGYLAFLGRISPEKGPVEAIRIARAAGMPLKIAAKVDKVDEEYFKERVQPLLSEPGIEFIGEINDREKSQFLGNALGLLFPICWPEPFGLVMIEAMACGTPVLAFPYGSVREIVDDGVNGRIVNNVEEAVIALPDLLSLDRNAVRRCFEERFSVQRMAKQYVRAYRSQLRPQRPHRERALVATGEMGSEAEQVGLAT